MGTEMEASAARKPKRQKILILLMTVVALAMIAALAFLRLKAPATDEAPPHHPSQPLETAFVGHYDYVIRLPKGYAAVHGFKDAEKTVEVVHFCKAGTDPTNFLNEGLYAQLGIVRLETQPSSLAGPLDGIETLKRLVTGRTLPKDEKLRIKNLQISSLHGIQINFEGPFPRVEAYILGQKILYWFMAGQDDEIFREILTSLRETRSET
jgi:hypothetical protein